MSHWEGEDSAWKKAKMEAEEVAEWGEDDGRKVEPMETIGLLLGLSLFLIVVVFGLGFTQ